MGELTLLYDERCGFCTRVAGWLGRVEGITIVAIGAARGSELLHDLSPAERYASLHVVDRRGRRRSGGAALPTLLRAIRGGRLPAWLLERFPGVSEWGYRLVADNRGRLSKLPGLR